MRPFRALVATPLILAATSLAAQDTTRTRPVTTVSSGGEVALAAYDAPVGDTAIARLERFLTQYPQSALRPRALFQLGELLVRRADERFAESQRSAASSDTAARPDYRDATARYEELVSSYPNFERRDVAAY